PAMTTPTNAELATALDIIAQKLDAVLLAIHTIVPITDDIAFVRPVDDGSPPPSSPSTTSSVDILDTTTTTQSTTIADPAPADSLADFTHAFPTSSRWYVIFRGTQTGVIAGW